MIYNKYKERKNNNKWSLKIYMQILKIVKLS